MIQHDQTGNGRFVPSSHGVDERGNLIALDTFIKLLDAPRRVSEQEFFVSAELMQRDPNARPMSVEEWRAMRRGPFPEHLGHA